MPCISISDNPTVQTMKESAFRSALRNAVIKNKLTACSWVCLKDSSTTILNCMCYIDYGLSGYRDIANAKFTFHFGSTLVNETEAKQYLNGSIPRTGITNAQKKTG